MNTAAIINKSLESIRKSRIRNAGNEIFYRDPVKHDHQHEFLFFIKPEITKLNDQARIAAVLDMTLNKIMQFRLIIVDIRLLTASYLDKYDIIAQHYGVINSLSRQPMEHLSGDARSNFKASFGKSPEETNLLGSLQFIQKYPSFTPDSLEHLWRESKAVKLAGGTYCAKVKVHGEEVYLVNGFHPNQLIHFTTEGRCILAFTLTGNLDWSAARNQFIGKTNPAEAAPGSLRKELLVRKQQFSLQDVSASQNGFHLSAGPLEGLVELIRYCSDFSTGDRKKTEDFVFGRQLKSNFNSEEIEKICRNQPVIYKGNKITPFDLTEEKNSRDAITLLKDGKIL